jgi:anthranilate phosphoribosyltransferase
MKEESGAEIAGFAKAVRKHLPPPAPGLVAFDWSSYAGKKRQLPWYVLAALALAQSGDAVFMHGFDGHTEGRLYTGEVFSALGIPSAKSLDEAASQLAAHKFAYMDLRDFSPPLARMMGFKPILGLRSPIHTLARMINPFAAPCLLQGIFHPNYMVTHRDAALLLGEKAMCVFRGEGGEIERRPSKPCEVLGVADGESYEERWPPIMTESAAPHEESLDLSRLAKLWRGETREPYGEAAIIGTLAIALRTRDRALDQPAALARAAEIWASRNPARWLAA